VIRSLPENRPKVKATASKGLRLLVGIRLDEVETVPAKPAVAPAPAAIPAPAAEAKPGPAPRPVAKPQSWRPPPPRAGLLKRNLPLVIMLVVLGVITFVGMAYYQLSVAQRVRHDYHDWLKPSGIIGQSAGIVAFLMFVFMYLYPLRKRLRRLTWLGSLPRWLDVHIVFGLGIPLLGAIHASWRFHGLIGLGYFSMLLVSLSGIVGKYLYAHIPHSRAGVELSMDELGKRRAILTDEIARKAGLDPAEVEAATASITDRRGSRGVLATLGTLLAADLVRFRTTRKLQRRWGKQCHLDKQALGEVIRLVRRQITLTQQRRMLEATQRVFRFWHVVHRPFSITAFVAVIIHVAVVVTMRVTWFW
jgi:hypothetical protein